MVGSNLGFPSVSGIVLTSEHVNEVVSHLFLGNNNFLSSLDDKVTSLVEEALSLLNSFLVSEVVEGAEFGSDHNWYFSDWDLLHKFVDCGSLLSSIWVLVVDSASHIHEEFGLVGQISEPGFIWVHILGYSVLVPVGGSLVDMKLLELELVNPRICSSLLTRSILPFWLDYNLADVFDDVLDSTG